MSSLKRGRGRLSVIDMLPDEAREDIDWALGELAERKREQKDILEEFNLRLCSKGIEPIAKSTFNRYSLKLARHARAMTEVREVAAMWAERMDEEPDGDVGRLINETIKTLIYEVVSDVPMDDAADSLKMLGQAALALQRLEQARGVNFRAALLKKEKFLADAAKEVEKAMKAKGMGAETVEAVKKLILGVPGADEDET